MTALEQFNALNGTKAYRKDLENILQKAKDENNASLVYRISKTLNAFPDVNRFEIEIISYPEAPQGLSGAQHSGNYKEALDDCGRLRKGWKFVKGNVVKIQKKEKPKKESKPKKETGPVKSKEENNSKKETKKDKKYKFVVITDDRPSRVIAVFSYTNPNIKDLRESFWKNGEGKYYETTEEGLRNYTFGMGVYPFEEAKKHIEEKYTEGKDFIYFIIEKDGGRDEAISLVEKPKKETNKTAIDEIIKIVQERLKNQGNPRLYEVLHLESTKGIFIFSWSDLGNIDGTKKKENALAKGLYQYTFPKFKTTQEKIEFSNQVWYDLLINKSLTLKRKIEEPTLNIINYYLGKNTIEDIERASKKTTEETKPKKGKTPKKETEPVKSKEENNSKKIYDVVFSQNKNGIFFYSWKDLGEFVDTERVSYKISGMYQYRIILSGLAGINKKIELIKELEKQGYSVFNISDAEMFLLSYLGKTPKKETGPVKAKGEKASNFSLLQEPTKVLLKFSKDTNKEYYKKYTDEKGFVGVDFLKDNLKDLKKQAIIEDPQGFINTEDFEKSHKASKIKGIDSLKTIVSKDKLYPSLECVFIEPDTYVATDALKIVVLNRPKNDGLKTGAFYDPNFKCEKLGGCSKEEFYKDLQQGFPNYKGVLFPKPKYFTEWIPLEPLIKHLKTGLEVLTKISGQKRVFPIAIKSNIEEKRFDIKNFLDALLVLESNEAKKIKIEAIDEFGNNRIQIKTDNNNLAVIMPLNPNSESSNVISPLKIAPIQLEFVLNETGPVKAKEEESKAEEKTSAKKELPRDFSEDLDYKSLYNSYSMSSFDPERRAENDKKMFGASMLNLYNSSVEEAKENNRLEEYNQAFERYYAVILKKNKEVISARTGTFSTAVTGRAGVKDSQLRKNEAKQKREYEINKELIDYIEKAEKKLNEVARNPDRFYSDQAIKSTDKNAIEKLNQKIEQLEAEKDFIKRSEKACKEYQKTKDFSVFEKYNIPQKEAKEYVEQIERHGLPLIKGISSISAEIRRVKERIALLEKSKASEDENFDIENGRILVNKEAQRVQIFFDNIPDANTRDALKKRAFKWAPSAKAWQRTLTGNAIDAVKYLIKDGVLVKKNSEKTGLNAPRHEGILKEALNECGRLKKGWKFEKGKAVKVDTKKGKDKEGEQKELDLYMQEMKTAIKKSKAGKFDKKNILSWLSKFPDKIKGQLYSFLYHNYLLDKEEAKLRKSKKSVPFSLINTQYDINKFVSQLFDLEKEDFFDLYFFFIYNMDECIELLEDKEVKKNYYEKKKKGLSGVDYSQALFDDIGLNAPITEVSTERFKNMSVPELREYTLEYYLENYGGKSISKNFFKEDNIQIEFFNTAGKKLQKPIYKEKVAVLEHLEALIKNSTYNNWGNRKESSPPNIIGYLNFKAKLTIDGEKRHVRISIAVDEKRKFRFKTFEVGANPKKKKQATSIPAPSVTERLRDNSLSEGKDTKKSLSRKEKGEKYGLSMPFYVQEQEKKEIQPSSNSISNKIKAFQGRNFEIFNIENPDLSTFLGEIERKNIGSNVITLTGGAGSGKTRFAFQFMNALAQNYKVGHASLEEHPESKLYFDKVMQYLDSQAQNNISVLENETLDGLENLINENEVIVIDSFAKLREMDSKFLVDKDLRKKYNGKLFLVIFQQTSDGKMRGGSTSEFDGDIILFTKTFDDPKENFVYPSKNRYNALPLSELKYSVFYQQLLYDEEEQE